MAVLNIKKTPLWRAGFTLIELLVSISIIATLTAILLPNFMGARERAKDSQTKQDLVAIKNALRLYYNDNQNYPATVSQSDLGTTLASYMPSITGLGFGYTYYQIPGGDGFQLCSGMSSTSDDITTSQLNCVDSNKKVCGVGLTSNPSLYVVCAN